MITGVQAVTPPQASIAVLNGLTGVTILLAAALLPLMAVALAASHTRAGTSAACLAAAGLSWVAVPLLWRWLAARYGKDTRLSAFVPAVAPSARPRRGALADAGVAACRVLKHPAMQGPLAAGQQQQHGAREAASTVGSTCEHADLSSHTGLGCRLQLGTITAASAG